jgi:hypothetical protein
MIMKNEEICDKLSEIQVKFSTYHAEVNAQNTVTNAALIGINEHLKQLNSKVATHEKIINDNQIILHDYNSYKDNRKDLPERVRKLEDCNLSNASIKKAMAAMFGGGIALGGIAIAIIELITG